MKPAPFTAEELQFDGDAEREAKVLEWIDLVDFMRRAAVVFAVALTLILALAALWGTVPP